MYAQSHFARASRRSDFFWRFLRESIRNGSRTVPFVFGFIFNCFKILFPRDGPLEEVSISYPLRFASIILGSFSLYCHGEYIKVIWHAS